MGGGEKKVKELASFAVDPRTLLFCLQFSRILVSQAHRGDVEVRHLSKWNRSGGSVVDDEYDKFIVLYTYTCVY